MSQFLDTSFSSAQLSMLSIAVLTLLVSLYLFLRGKVSAALILLFLGALLLRIFMILLDPFLNDWDERYHALVAKNMITHPFRPMLWVNPILEYDYRAWCCNHIWVHKQPFFLWQMALSMKLFGVHEWAMRLPSALMGAIQVFLIYRIGFRLHNRSLGYFAAFLFAVSYFQLEQTSGFMGREHNDVAFAFYITAGFWSLAEYLHSDKKRYLVLLGVFVGIAILIKWVVAFLVFGAWGLGLLLTHKDRIQWRRYREITLAGLLAVLVAFPWQVYIFIEFPKESTFVYGFHGNHLFETFDDQSGGILYYLEHNNWMYGDWSWILLVLGIFFFLRLVPNGLFKNICLSAVGLVYVVFSLAGTKSVSYVFVINFVIFLFLSAFILGIAGWIRERSHPKLKLLGKFTPFLLTVGIGFMTLQHWKIESTHIHGKGVERQSKVHNAQIYRKLDEQVPKGYILFNCFDAQEAMFYTDRTCYFWLEPEDYHQLKAKGVNMAAIPDYEYEIPFYLEQDPDVLILSDTLQ